MLTLISCNQSEKKELEKEGIETEDIIVQKPNYKVNQEANDLNEQQKDTISQDKLKGINFLKDNRIIPVGFSSNNVIFYKNYSSKELRYNILKMVYDPTIGDEFLEDPYINIVYITKENQLIDYSVLYSIEEEDVTYAFNIDDNVFFEQYDSSTGWKKYLTYIREKLIFIETSELDEQEEIVQKSIDLEKLTYKTSYSNEIKTFKSN